MVLMPGDLVGDEWEHNLQHECFTDRVSILRSIRIEENIS